MFACSENLVVFLRYSDRAAFSRIRAFYTRTSDTTHFERSPPSRGAVAELQAGLQLQLLGGGAYLGGRLGAHRSGLAADARGVQRDPELEESGISLAGTRMVGLQLQLLSGGACLGGQIGRLMRRR